MKRYIEESELLSKIKEFYKATSKIHDNQRELAKIRKIIKSVPTAKVQETPTKH